MYNYFKNLNKYKNKIFIFLIKKKLILRKIKIDKMDENFEEQQNENENIESELILNIQKYKV